MYMCLSFNLFLIHMFDYIRLMGDYFYVLDFVFKMVYCFFNYLNV